MVLPVEVLTVTIRPAGVLTTVPGTGAGFGVAAGRGRGAGLGEGAGLTVGSGGGWATGSGLVGGATLTGVGFGAGAAVGLAVGVGRGLGVARGAGFAVAVGVGLGAGLAAKAGAAISAAARMITGVDRDMEAFPSELPVSAEGASMSLGARPVGGTGITNPSSARHELAHRPGPFNHGSAPHAHSRANGYRIARTLLSTWLERRGILAPCA